MLTNILQVKKKYRQGDEAIGKSKGGKSTKVHASVDALGNPRRLILTPGQAHDVRSGADLIEGENTKAVIADKAYDSDEFLALIAQMRAEAAPVNSKVKSSNCNIIFQRLFPFNVSLIVFENSSCATALRLVFPSQTQKQLFESKKEINLK